MLGECQTLLHDFSLQAQSSDTWQWRLDHVRGFSVRGAYQLLTTHPIGPVAAVEDLIWHKHVPLKVSIFAWRLLRDRLPTKINLARGIITPEAQFCVTGCEGVESAQHLFLSCSIFGFLWSSAALERVAPFYNLSGFYALGLSGMKEIKDYSATQNSPYLICWT
ncbi:70 kDa peptidyl-prolyl isomerase, partial [Trifolium medium]|nr:70 kDa peptidyl-prolyl isomerase [Trifolium medium]